jgi:hypothetical protein
MMHFYDHGKPHPNDRIVSAAFLTSLRTVESGKPHHREAGRQSEDERPRYHGSCLGKPVHPIESARRRTTERSVHGVSEERRERVHGPGQRRFGGIRFGVMAAFERSVLATSPGMAELDPDVPDEQDWHVDLI